MVLQQDGISHLILFCTAILAIYVWQYWGEKSFLLIILNVFCSTPGHVGKETLWNRDRDGKNYLE